MSTIKVIVDGEECWPNPNYVGTPLPEGHDWRGSIPQLKQRDYTPASYIADCKFGDSYVEDDFFVCNIQQFKDGRKMADVRVRGNDWQRYVCTRAEIEKRSGGQLVDAALEVVA
jgi:hypothetical protein